MGFPFPSLLKLRRVRLWHVVLMLVALAGAPTAGAALPAVVPGDHPSGLDIQVADQGWGQVSAQEIQAVLYAVAEELLARQPAKIEAPIRVAHTSRNPIVLYDRGDAGEYRILLHASGSQWPLYVYEFAHEFCHILSNYDHNVVDGVARQNQWFEEALCESASLYALETVAASWERQPATERKIAGGQLRRFFDQLVNERHRHLAPDVSFATWLHDNEARLRRDPYQRDMDDVAAQLLLPLFEQAPASWNALRYLNLEPSDTGVGLTQYLQHWYEHAPQTDRVLVGRVRALFDPEKDPPPHLLVAPTALVTTSEPSVR